MNRRALILSLPCLLLAGCIPGASGDPAPEGYRRVEGGILVPAETGPYDLQRVEVSPNVLVGTVARYAIPKDQPQATPSFDLFIYPMAGRELEDEIAEARQQLRMWDEVNDNIHSTTLAPTVTLNTIYAPHPLFLTPILSVQDNVEIRSYMYITRVAQRFLKVRVSYPSDVPENIDRAMHRRIEQLVDDIARQAEP